MENQHHIDQMIDEARRYADVSVDRLKLQLIDNLSLVFGKSLAVVIAILLIAIALVMIACLLTLLLSNLVGMVWALVIMAVVLIVAALLIVTFKDRLFTDGMVRMFVKMFYPEPTAKTDNDENREPQE